mmetsp:Transcript_64742/g.171363  ORF Transcript_64742/g.171363 Transcript_64742/m.171363 type:complete len:98 (-) Transcript_64742:192-485(-)
MRELATQLRATSWNTVPVLNVPAGHTRAGDALKLLCESAHESGFVCRSPVHHLSPLKLSRASLRHTTSKGVVQEVSVYSVVGTVVKDFNALFGMLTN